MSILRIKKGAEINLFLERSRKRVREKSGKKISLASRRRDREYRKRFFPCELARKKEWEKIQKRIFSAKERREREYRKRFFHAIYPEKRVREFAEKDSLC